MYKFIETDNKELFDNFVLENKGSYLQSFNWAFVKTNWNYRHYLGYFNNKIVLSCLVLIRNVRFGNIFYSPCGPVCDYTNKCLIQEFSNFIKNELKNNNAFVFTIDPLIPLRIDHVDNIEGKNAHSLLTSLGYILNSNLESYIYKSPVQTIISLKDNNHQFTIEELIKKFDKGVRYSIRNSLNKGLVYYTYNYEDLIANSQLLKDYFEVMSDTQERNNFLAKDENYLMNLFFQFKNNLDLTIVYYDKNEDYLNYQNNLNELENLNKSAESLTCKEQNKIQEKIKIYENRISAYLERKKVMLDFPDRVAIAAGLTMRYNGVASCLFGGSRNILRNNTRPSHFLNYLRIQKSVEDNYDYHDLGYILCDNPILNSDGTLGDIKPRYDFIGIADFKKSFNTKYYEYIGEYSLVTNKFKYMLFHDFIYSIKRIIVNLKKIKSHLR